MSFDLYQQVILDHNRKPRNCGALEGHTHTCHGHNPLCGDDYTVYLKVTNEQIEQVTFEGNGCAISKASASMMTQSLQGKNIDQAQALFEEFHQMVLGNLDAESTETQLGKLKIFQGVRAFPSRVKCASLSWHAMHTALTQKEDEVSTE
ncbi:MAG: SUF system NifU family Fe-S cluster assembly protein [Planctomycetota bacterium]|jgi:nitrogen fixation NifU-like protein|nr:SUF system NifU family Fe-S cluster assembly protein [Planctomycetota bacterium]